jgi:hypothetical protein
MALSELGGGSQTATVGTEHTLHTETSGKVCVFVVDTANLAGGDTVELRIYTIARASGTERLAYYATYSHVQGEPMKYSVPVPANISFKATLKQTAGTGRAFVWAVLGV